MDNMAYGWVLTASSTSGGKVYQVAVVGNLVIVGWGSRGTPTLQYKVAAYHNPAEARRVALGQTSLKEDKGYVLTTEPRAHQIDESTLAELQRMVGHRGGNFRLQQAFDMLMEHGTTAS